MENKAIVWTLTAVLCAGLLTGCGADDPVPTPEPTVPAVPATPNVVVDVPDPEQTPDVQEFVLILEGEEERGEMTRVGGVFPDGPSFSLYVDKSRFTVNDVDGYCYLNNESGTAYAELGFRAGADGESLSGTILNEYGRMQSTEDLGETPLGEQTARCVVGRTLDTVFTVYLIDTQGGCVTAVVSRPDSTEFAEGAQVRLQAMLTTLELS